MHSDYYNERRNRILQLENQELRKEIEQPAWYRRHELFQRKERIPIMLVPWSYDVPEFTYYRTLKNHKSIICNCMSGSLGVPCVPCHYAYKLKDLSYAAKKHHAITVIVLQYFHRKKDAKGITQYYKCTGHNCKYCRMSAPRSFGLRRYLSIPDAMAEDVLHTINNMFNTCIACGETLDTERIECPKCHKDISTSTTRISDEMTCPHCLSLVEPKIVLNCVKMEGWDVVGKGCDTPTQIEGVYDYIFELGSVDDDFYLRPIDLQTHKETMPLVKKHVKKWFFEPLPFTEFLLTQTLQEQSRDLGRANPYSPEKQLVVDSSLQNKLFTVFGDFVEEY